MLRIHRKKIKVMRFKISKSKTSLLNKETHSTNNNGTTRFLNSNKKVINNENENESKSTNFLFSLKSKTKMKRTHQVKNGIVFNTVLACKNEKKIEKQQNFNDNVNNEKIFRKVNFKQYGANFVNLFKSNVCFNFFFISS